MTNMIVLDDGFFEAFEQRWTERNDEGEFVIDGSPTVAIWDFALQQVGLPPLTLLPDTIQIPYDAFTITELDRLTVGGLTAIPVPAKESP